MSAVRASTGSSPCGCSKPRNPRTTSLLVSVALSPRRLGDQETRSARFQFLESALRITRLTRTRAPFVPHRAIDRDRVVDRARIRFLTRIVEQRVRFRHASIELRADPTFHLEQTQRTEI